MVWHMHIQTPNLFSMSSRTKLLDVEKDPRVVTPPDTPPHHDERQISLDTDRSFVLYPVGGHTFVTVFQLQSNSRLFVDTEYDRESLQAGLRDLLVSLFRKRPRLSYFQVRHRIPPQTINLYLTEGIP
jgi:hypothetical protein